MKSKTILIAAGVVVLFGVMSVGIFAAGAATQSMANSGEVGPIRRLIRSQFARWSALRSEVNLTGQQRQQIAQLIRNHRQEIASALQPVIADKRALRDAISGGDEAKIRAESDELGKAIGDASVLASHIKAEARGIITPQQQQSIDAFRRQSEAAVDQAIAELGSDFGGT